MTAKSRFKICHMYHLQHVYINLRRSHDGWSVRSCVRSSVVRAAGVFTDHSRKTIQRDLSTIEFGGLGVRVWVVVRVWVRVGARVKVGVGLVRG